MQIDQNQGNVQIFNTYDTRFNACFYRGIHFKDGAVQVEINNCKPADRDIDFDPSDFSHLKSVAILSYGKGASDSSTLSAKDLQRLFPKRQVLDTIFNYAQRRFRRATCEHRSPKVQLLESKKLLRFEVVDLCKIVLAEENPKVCRALQFFNYPCNWIKREKLIFTITYKETTEGFNIHCSIDGLYGSGYYDQVQRGGYKNMELEFNEELEHFADIFKEEIRQLLRN